MADNVTMKNATGQTVTVRATDTAGVHTPHNIVEVAVTAAGLGKAEDAAHASGDTGVAVLARRKDSPAVSSGTDGDYSTVDVGANGAVWTTPTPATQGGLSIYRTLDLDETEEEVKATAGQLYGYYFFNAAATKMYLKFYNATAANVTVGTTTPVLTFPLPTGAAGHIEFAHGIAFSTAICAAATTGLADADTGAPAANDVILNVFFK